MKWLDLITKLVGPLIGAIKAIAKDDWDEDEAAKALAELAKNPPRRAVDDAKRDALRDIAEGE